MRKCIYCGAQVEEDSIFCSYCGKKIEFRSCPHCGTELEEDSVFCSKCGMRQQAIPEDTPPQYIEIQDVDSIPKKYSLWHVICCCIAIVFFIISGLYALQYFKQTSPKEANSTTNVNNEKELFLIGDADGFPLELTLSIVNGNVTGIYKNINYGTTMTVHGTIVDNVIYLEGAADNTNYEFQIIAEGENYTGTFGKAGGKKMNLHLRNNPGEVGLFKTDEMNSDVDGSRVKKKIKSAFINVYNDVVNSFDITDPENIGFICEYFMYDITGDGIPEFWIKYGISEAGYQIRACAYDKDSLYKIIWEGSAGHTSFYEGNGYILRVYAHMGEAFWSKLSYNGNKIVESGTVFEENTEEIDDDGCISYREYTKPKEKYIDLYPLSNVEPMNRALGLN